VHVCGHLDRADALAIGVKRAQRHEEVHAGARQELAVEEAPVLALDDRAQVHRGSLGPLLGQWLLKCAGSGADFGVVCWLDTSATVAQLSLFEDSPAPVTFI